ncbi:MAG: hypothetical protein J3R72DRAFT_87651 [Linnemannia gamsii]|nr:MAG: hypothetical protein J3R72DRAFT_87651 [Linnemannia gamsii]
MSSFINPLYPENHIQTVRQLYLDAALLEQTIQQHVEASKVGYRSSNSTSHPSSPVNDHRRFNLSDTSSTTSHHSQRRQNSVSSTNSRRSGGGGGGRQQQQTPQEEQGFQVPSSDHFRSGHEELAFLRDSLKDVYESVLLEDLVAAVEKSVDDRLWRYVFYAPVEELRAELRKLEKNSIRRQEVMDELSKLLDKGTGFYHEMIMALRSEHNLDLGNIAVEVLHADLGTPNRNKPADSARFSQQQQSQQQQQQQQQQQRSRNGRSRQQSKNKEEASISSSSTPTYSKESLANCIQKCFIYLGDLARYRTNIRLETQTSETASKVTGNGTTQSKPSASDWQAAFRFYQRAIRVFPDSGKPYGQLAILSSYASDDIDALFWYCMSLGAKSPSVVVRDNLKVFFSRYQNRFKDLLVSICPNAEDSKGAMAMSLDDEEDADSSIENEPNLAQQLALARCDLSVLLIKVQMDLFAPHLRSVTFHNSTVLDALCQKLSSRLASRGFEGSAQKMVASMVFIVYDLHARTTLSSFPTESTTKEGSMGLKQAQRAGLIYLLRIATVLLDRQLLVLSYMGGRKKGKSTSLPRLDRELMAPVHCLIEFWMSYWDQIWGMIRLEEKWAGAPNTSGSSDLSLKSAAVTFFRSYVNLLNMDRVQYADEPNVDDVSQRALCLLQQDRGDFYGLMPFRRFHLLLVPCMDTPEDMEETRFNRLLLFAAKIIQASEGIRGTVIEMSFEPVGAASDAVNPSVNRQSQYRVLDADDKVCQTFSPRYVILRRHMLLFGVIDS